MKSFKEFNSNMTEGHDRFPSDEMTMKELRIAINSAKNIVDMMEQGASVQRWQISAIVKASDELASVYTSMSADMPDEDDYEDYEDEVVGYEYPSMYGEAAESQAQAISARIALKHKKDGTKPEAGTASAEMMDMSVKELEDFTKVKKGAPYKVSDDLDEATKSPYSKAGTALWNAAQEYKGTRDYDDLMYHRGLFKSTDPKEHEFSAKSVRNLDTAMRDVVSDAVHRNSSKANSLKWHKAAGLKRTKD